MEKHSVDSKTAAEILGFKEQTLRAWRSSGKQKISYFRIGRAIRYSVDDLKAFIEQHRVTE
jgi:predicted site-specific integrase-resolvase